MKKLALLVLILGSFALAQKPKALATSHDITLTWTASNSPGIVGYPVYRSLTTGGPYTLIATAPTTVPLTYVDTTVAQGTKYFYVLRAKDANLESVNSTEVSATVPTDPVAPNPPINPSAVAH